LELIYLRGHLWTRNAPEESAIGRRHKRSRYRAEFNAEAVRVVIETDESIASIARDLGVSEPTLHAWVEAARPQPKQPLTDDERTELVR